MNNTFSAKRFGNYFLYDLRRLWAGAGLPLLILSLMPLILWFFTGVYGVLITHHWVLPPLDARIACVVAAMFIGSLMLPSRVYGYLTDKRAGSEWLMIPASRLEKFLSMILVTIVVIPLVFVCLTLLSDGALSLFSKDYGMLLSQLNLNEAMKLESDDIHIAGGGWWFVYFWVSGVLLEFLLGAIFFKKQKVAKTILVLLGIGFVFSSIVIPLIVNDILDIEGLADMVADWVEANMHQMEFWINFFIDASYALRVGVLGLLIWLRIKTLKH